MNKYVLLNVMLFVWCLVYAVLKHDSGGEVLNEKVFWRLGVALVAAVAAFACFDDPTK